MKMSISLKMPSLIQIVEEKNLVCMKDIDQTWRVRAALCLRNRFIYSRKKKTLKIPQGMN